MEEEKDPWFKPIFKFWKRTIDFIDSLVWNVDDGLRNYFKWRKIIWLDHQWDQTYLLKILKFKMEQMEKYFKYNGISVDGPEDAKKIERCVILLDRLLKDNYSDVAYEEYNKKWKEDVEDYLDLKKILNKTITPQQRTDLKNAAQTEEELIEKDYEELFGIMKKEIRKWWD